MSTSGKHWAIEAFYLKDKEGRPIGQKLYGNLSLAIHRANADSIIAMVPSENALRCGQVINARRLDLFVVHSVNYFGWIKNILIATTDRGEAQHVLDGESGRAHKYGPPMLRAVPLLCFRLTYYGEQQRMLRSLRCGKYAKVSR